jgi:hypothetical protein
MTIIPVFVVVVVLVMTQTSSRGLLMLLGQVLDFFSLLVVYF